MPHEKTRTSKPSSMAACALALCTAVACGSTTSGVDASLDDAGGAPDVGTADGSVSDASTRDAPDDDASVMAKPRAIVRMNGGAAADCATVPAMAVGDFGDVSMGIFPIPVQTGERQAGKVVTIQCRVVSDGSGYVVEGNVAVDGDAALSLRGTVAAGGKGSATAFSLKKTVGWSSTSCTLDTTLRPGAGVAAGRVWAMVSCGGAKSDTGGTCDIFGEIRLENCGQL